jgi:predicted CXXCH cytochrome family protein
MLLKESAHNPVSEKSCDACHPSPDSKTPFAVTEKGKALCFQCHDEPKLTAGGTVLHNPFGGGECLSCHDPHASRNTKLLVKNGNALCLECHGEQGKRVAKSHDAVTKGKGCLSCHMPHAAKNKGLLVAKDSDLCYTCHAKVKASQKAKTQHEPFPRGVLLLPQPPRVRPPGY